MKSRYNDLFSNNLVNKNLQKQLVDELKDINSNDQCVYVGKVKGEHKKEVSDSYSEFIKELKEQMDEESEKENGLENIFMNYET